MSHLLLSNFFPFIIIVLRVFCVHLARPLENFDGGSIPWLSQELDGDRMSIMMVGLSVERAQSVCHSRRNAQEFNWISSGFPSALNECVDLFLFENDIRVVQCLQELPEGDCSLSYSCLKSPEGT
jgi:hypothetical protein